MVEADGPMITRKIISIYNVVRNRRTSCVDASSPYKVANVASRHPVLKMGVCVVPSTEKIPQVLLVEDSDDDAFFFQRIADRSGIEFHLTHVINGLEAVEVLKKSSSQSIPDAVPPPDLIFLDLKMPDFSGFDVLSWVKNQDSLPKLNIAVLSGSQDAADIRRATSLGATACFTKPLQVSQLQAMLNACGFGSPASQSPSPAGKPAPSA